MVNEHVSDEQLWSWVDRDAAELAEHLASHPDDQQRVDRLRAQIGSVRQAVSRPDLPEWIGRYEVTGLLGAGAMGVVYAAVQPSPRREVAVKVLREPTAGDGADERVRRFAAEVEALGRIRHPHVATVYEAGVTAEGLPFLVMERAHGEPLDRWARDEPSMRRRLEVFADACDGVAAAHAEGVVHRDLKPDHVLVDPATGRPRILDFGLARLTAPQASDPPLTRAGQLAGTLPWMAPEQLEGRIDAIGPATDVWALGVLLHQVVRGSLPFGGMEKSWTELSGAIQRDDPPRIAHRLTGPLTRPLNAVLAKALHRQPRRRYADAGHFARDLRRLLAGEPTEARPIGVLGRGLRLLRTPKVAIPAALLLTAAFAWWVGSEGFDPRAVEDRNSLARYATADTPRRAVFPEVRLSWAGPEVRRAPDDEWAQWLTLNGVDVELLLARCPGETTLDKTRHLALHHLEVLAEVLPDASIERLRATLRPLGGSTIQDVPVLATARVHAALDPATIEDVAPQRPGSRSTTRSHDAYTAAAAFTGLRWLDESRCEVQLDDGWHELLGIFDLPLDEALRLTAAAFPEDPLPRRFTEDFAEVLERHGYRVGDTMHIALRGADGEQVTRTVPFTSGQRHRLLFEVPADFRAAPGTPRPLALMRLLMRDDLRVSCFDAWTWDGSTADVRIGERAGELVEIEGRSLQHLLGISARVFGSGDTQRRLREDFPILLAIDGTQVGSSVSVELRDPTTGDTLAIDAAPLSSDTRRRLLEAAKDQR